MTKTKTRTAWDKDGMKESERWSWIVKSSRTWGTGKRQKNNPG